MDAGPVVLRVVLLVAHGVGLDVEEVLTFAAVSVIPPVTSAPTVEAAPSAGAVVSLVAGPVDALDDPLALGDGEADPLGVGVGDGDVGGRIVA